DGRKRVVDGRVAVGRSVDRSQGIDAVQVTGRLQLVQRVAGGVAWPQIGESIHAVAIGNHAATHVMAAVVDARQLDGDSGDARLTDVPLAVVVAVKPHESEGLRRPDAGEIVELGVRRRAWVADNNAGDLVVILAVVDRATDAAGDLAAVEEARRR